MSFCTTSRKSGLKFAHFANGGVPGALSFKRIQLSFELAYDFGTEERGNQQNVNEGIVFTKTNPPDTKWSVVQNRRRWAALVPEGQK